MQYKSLLLFLALSLPCFAISNTNRMETGVLAVGSTNNTIILNATTGTITINGTAIGGSSGTGLSTNDFFGLLWPNGNTNWVRWLNFTNDVNALALVQANNSSAAVSNAVTSLGYLTSTTGLTNGGFRILTNGITAATVSNGGSVDLLLNSSGLAATYTNTATANRLLAGGNSGALSNVNAYSQIISGVPVVSIGAPYIVGGTIAGVSPEGPTLLEIVNVASNQTCFDLITVGDASTNITTQNTIHFLRGQGTTNSMKLLRANTTVSSFGWRGVDTDGATFTGSAQADITYAPADWSSTSHPLNRRFETTPIGSTTRSWIAVFNAAGTVAFSNDTKVGSLSFTNASGTLFGLPITNVTLTASGLTSLSGGQLTINTNQPAATVTLFAGSATTGQVTSAAGDAGKFLRADATWQTPAGGGSATGLSSIIAFGITNTAAKAIVFVGGAVTNHTISVNGETSTVWTADSTGGGGGSGSTNLDYVVARYTNSVDVGLTSGTMTLVNFTGGVTNKSGRFTGTNYVAGAAPAKVTWEYTVQVTPVTSPQRLYCYVIENNTLTNSLALIPLYASAGSGTVFPFRGTFMVTNANSSYQWKIKIIDGNGTLTGEATAYPNSNPVGRFQLISESAP